MIQIKHFLEAPTLEDGVRLWVEPFGITRDFRIWCSIDDVLPQIGPTMVLWYWYERHPGGYEYFRGRYQDQLSRGTFTSLLRKIEYLSQQGTVTLLHQGNDPQENTAAALRDFVSQMSLRK